MNLFVFWLALNFKIGYLIGQQRTYCNFQHLELQLKWPFFEFTQANHLEYKEIGQNFIIGDIVKKFPENNVDHDGECVKMEYDYVLTEDAETYFPQTLLGEDNERYLMSKWNESGVCQIGNPRFGNPTEYFDFFINQAKDFNERVFEEALETGVCRIERYIPNISPGFYACYLEDLKGLVEREYNTRPNFICHYNNLWHSSTVHYRHIYSIQGLFLREIRICFDHQGTTVDCEIDPEDCGDHQDTFEIFLPYDWTSQSFEELDPDLMFDEELEQEEFQEDSGYLEP